MSPNIYSMEILKLGKDDTNLQMQISNDHDFVFLTVIVCMIGLVLIYQSESNSKKLDELKKLIEKKK